MFPLASSAIPSGESRPVLPPRMVAIGGSSPAAVGAKIEIVLIESFATYVLPMASIAMSDAVRTRPITASGATSPFRPGSYAITELLVATNTSAVGGDSAVGGVLGRFRQADNAKNDNESAALHIRRGVRLKAPVES